MVRDDADLKLRFEKSKPSAPVPKRSGSDLPFGGLSKKIIRSPSPIGERESKAKRSLSNDRTFDIKTGASRTVMTNPFNGELPLKLEDPSIKKVNLDARGVHVDGVSDWSSTGQCSENDSC